ncbi:MAG: hypothetical protein CENE_02083 [Candidatus Celerinatantimonas neptuna]|nr:MAG: hypothetical protein CENE_02083 [Candidatus Celerinatantimonas neptuna]
MFILMAISASIALNTDLITYQKISFYTIWQVVHFCHLAVNFHPELRLIKRS